MPSTPSAEGRGTPEPDPLGTTEADRRFVARRRLQLQSSTRRPAVMAVVAVVAVVAALGVAFGRSPSRGNLRADAAELAASGKLEGERGGSSCVGWPAELTISSKPDTVAPDRVLLFLSQRGWHVAVGADLVAAGASVTFTSPTGRFRAHSSLPAGVEVVADGGDAAVVTASMAQGPSGTATLTTACTVDALDVEVRTADGSTTGPDTLVYANGEGPGTNPATFERATS